MADSLTGISSMATRRILADLAADYKQQTGCTVAIRSMGGVDAARTVRAGTNADVVVLASNVLEQLESEGHIFSGSRQDFAKSGIAIAVPTGMKPPAIESADSVKQALLAARRIGYSTGPSGDHLTRLWEQWGITATMSQKAIQAPAGVPVGALLARGDADLGFQQLSELLGFPGVDIAGLLPPEIQATTIFATGIARSSSNSGSARKLIAFLVSPGTASIKRKHGMDQP